MVKLSLLGSTKARILKYLLSRKRSAKEIASIFHIQVSAARKNLESLQKLGIVTEEYLKEGMGRPKKFYVLTDEGRELLPKHYDTILNAFIAKMIQDGNATYAESIIRQIAANLAEAMNPGTCDERERIKRIVAALNGLGFEASLEENNGSYAITSNSCPLHKTALTYQKLVCHGLHDELIKCALGVKDVRLEKCMVFGDGLCRHLIPRSAMEKIAKR